MINLIYKSFPYGTAEAFAEYEIPYINALAGKEYRVFSFCGSASEKRNINIKGEVYLIKPNAGDYFRGVLSIISPHGIKELGYVKKRACRDSLSRCLWRIAYYHAYGYALLRCYKKAGGGDDEVFASYWMNECAYAALYMKKRLKNVKAVSRGHGFDLYEERCYLPFRKDLLCGLDRIYLVNGVEKEYLLDRYKGAADESKLTVSHLGIEVPEEYPAAPDRKKFVIVTCSSVIQLKRLDLLTDALAEIKEFDFIWYHIGDGPLFDNIKERAKEKLCEKNQKYEFVGQIPLEEVHKFYRENGVSLFVNCSDTEGVPVSIMEAMSYGIPTVARDAGGNSEIVNENNGILIKKDCTPAELAFAISKIYNCSDEEYGDLRRGAYQTVSKEFSAKTQYSKFFEQLKDRSF